MILFEHIENSKLGKKRVTLDTGLDSILPSSSVDAVYFFVPVQYIDYIIVVH